MVGIIVLLFSGLLLIILGWLLAKKEMYWMISGYNTMSKERKKLVDVEGLARFLAKHLYVMGFIFLLAALFISINLEYLTLAIIFLLLPQTIILIIKAQSFDQGAKNENGGYKTSAKLTIGFMILVFVGVAFLLFRSLTPAEIIIGNDSLEIEGLDGKQILYETIQEVYIEETRPNIISRNNGTSIADIRKGHFTLDNRRRALLFLEPDNPPYLFIITERDRIIISRENREQTEQIYREITDNLR